MRKETHIYTTPLYTIIRTSCLFFRGRRVHNNLNAAAQLACDMSGNYYVTEMFNMRLSPGKEHHRFLYA
jgi:hypothetical protein